MDLLLNGTCPRRLDHVLIVGTRYDGNLADSNNPVDPSNNGHVDGGTSDDNQTSLLESLTFFYCLPVTLLIHVQEN